MGAGGIPGPVPKPNAARPENTHGMKVVRPDGVLRGPELPVDRIWGEKTLEWYHGWRESPLAQLFEPQDWDVLQGAAYIHDKLWNPNGTLRASEVAQLSKELDRKVGNFGATYGDRLRLRIFIDRAPLEDGFEDAEVEDTFYEDNLL